MKISFVLALAATLVSAAAAADFPLESPGRSIWFDAPPALRPSPVPSPRVLAAPERANLGMVGEFEQQDFLFLSSGELTSSYARTIAEIARAVRSHVQLVIFYATDEQRTWIELALRQRLPSLEGIELVKMPHDTKWIRDFGPTFLRHGDQSVVIDWGYDRERAQDDFVPVRVAAMSETPCEHAAIALEGGNLLCNGQGLYLTTTTLFDRNVATELNELDVRAALQGHLGDAEVVVLESLAHEPTGHVDMFATFTAPDTVVVGQYNVQDDAENAAILNRNAARLAEVRTPHGQLRVERIPMGSNQDGRWRTYTNCIYANDVLLMPYYRTDDRTLQNAVDLYRQLLPGWKVVLIDALDLVSEGGALHCISLNAPSLPQPFKTDVLSARVHPRLLSVGVDVVW